MGLGRGDEDPAGAVAAAEPTAAAVRAASGGEEQAHQRPAAGSVGTRQGEPGRKLGFKLWRMLFLALQSFPLSGSSIHQHVAGIPVVSVLSRSKLGQDLQCQCPNADDEIGCPGTVQCARTDTQDTGNSKTNWQVPDCTVKKKNKVNEQSEEGECFCRGKIAFPTAGPCPPEEAWCDCRYVTSFPSHLDLLAAMIRLSPHLPS